MSFLPILFAACTTPSDSDAQGDLDTLAAWMSGSFSSQAQAEADPEFFDIRLHMAPIWKDRTDGYWFYVEQAAASSLNRPYRQRVYHLTQHDETTFESAVFELSEPDKHIGAWNKPEPLIDLTPASLIRRPGASIFLKRKDEESFAGSTDGKKCLSDYRGASYATSEVEITEKWIYSWDRGFDAEDNQVWGAVKGGYLFDRVGDL